MAVAVGNSHFCARKSWIYRKAIIDNRCENDKIDLSKCFVYGK